METPTNRPVPAAHAPKSKPDAWPMRLALGAGGIAAVSALTAAIVMPPQTVTNTQVTQQTVQQPLSTPVPASTIQVVQPVKYVQLLPGQTPPPGAQVISPADPTPRTVVVNVPAPAAKRPAAQPPAAQKPVYIKTTQSGTVVP